MRYSPPQPKLAYADPMRFVLLQQSRHSMNCSEIIDFRVKPEFYQIQKQIYKIQQKIYQQTDLQKRQQLGQKMMSLEEERVQHDFALLKLEQKINRSKYFELLPNLNQISNLTIPKYFNPYEKNNWNFRQKVLSIYNANPLIINDDTIYYDINLEDGYEGSPVFVENYGNKVVGIHLGYDYKTDLHNAVKITKEIIDLLRQWSVQMDSPLLKRINRCKKINTNDFPHNCIGWISQRTIYKATGFLISNNFVLSSAQSIENYKDKCGKSVQNYILFSMAGMQKKIKVKEVRFHPKFKELQNQINELKIQKQKEATTTKLKFQMQKQIYLLQEKQSKYNIAILKLQQKIQRSQYFKLLSQLNPFNSHILTISGFQCNQNGYDEITHSGQIKERRDGTIFYDIDTVKGQNGSPVYLKNQVGKVVAIHQDYHKYFSSSDYVHFGTLITKQVIEWLNEWCFEMQPLFQIIDSSANQQNQQN